MVATCVVKGYLLNRMVDFINFLQANSYVGVGLTIKNSAPLDQCLGHERISWLAWQPSRFHGNEPRQIFFVPNPDVPAKFGPHRPLNDGVVSGQTRPQTLLKL